MYYKGTNLKAIDKSCDYKLNDPSINNVNNLGFRFKRSMTSAENSVYEYAFPVYRYHAAISLECRFLLWLDSNVIKVDVFDTATHGIYAPWYYDNSGIHKDIIKIINRNINKEMNRMGISEK